MNGIGLREAAERYGVPRSTLSNWVARGLIRVVQSRATRGQAIRLYEEDVRELAQQYQPGRGRWHGPSLESAER